MDWAQPEWNNEGLVKIPATWLYNHYYEALNALFRIENSLRTFVFIVLKDNKKLAWSQLSMKTEDASDTTIESISKRRLSQDRMFGYLGYPIASPLMHLTSGELIRIILSDPYWPMFAKHFPAQREIVQTKLEEIGNVRNALAHFRPITRDDVQVVKQNAKQVLSGVEELLVSVVDCSDIVPSNSKHAWYKNLRTLSGSYVELEFNQSVDTKWVRLGIKYSCPTVSVYLSERYRSYRVLSINTPLILIDSKTILPNVIFVTEQVPYVSMPAAGNPAFSKTVRLLFSADTITDKHEELKKELDELLERITNETDLIKEDNLARGDIVQWVTASATRDPVDRPWQIDLRSLRSPSDNDDPSEYWSSPPFWGVDFVSNTDSFPWMPVKVAESDFLL